MEYLFLLIVLALGGYLIFTFSSKKEVSNPALKKQEIIENYKTSMRNILIKYKNNPTKQKEEKLKFIKEANASLNRNIYFTQDEITKVIKTLASMN